MSCLGISRAPPSNTRQDQSITSCTSSVPKKCAINSFDSFYIKCKAKLEASIIRLPALGAYISAGNNFQTNIIELNVTVHRGCSVTSSLTNEMEFTSVSSLPMVGCPLVNLNPQPSWTTTSSDFSRSLPIIYKTFYSVLLNLGPATHTPGI